ncbi:dynamin family protein [Mariniluteicoccus flavus]
MSQALAGSLRELCGDLSTRHPQLVPAVGRIAATLDEPLRLAVVGRVKTGKSTLVNALVGRRVAPTAAGECTKVVTWYRFGSPDRAVVITTDGRERHLPLVDGHLPADLGVDPTRVRRVEVFLQSAALRTKTLIDTPGLASATTAVSQDSAAEADALLFLVREADRLDEVAFWREFADACGPFASAGVNVAAALSHADLTGDGQQDPFPLAAGLAARLAADHHRVLAGVVPVAGLLAETARTGNLTDHDARALAALATADPTRLRLALAGHLPPGELPVEGRHLDSLAQRLGAYATLAAPHHARDARALLDWLDATSGVAVLERLIADELESRATLLKSARALAALAKVVRGIPRAEAAVEAAGLDPVAHPVRELVALQRLRADDPDSPALDALLEQLRTPPFTRELTPAEWARRAGLAQAEATMSLTPVEADAWRVLARSFQRRAVEEER